MSNKDPQYYDPCHIDGIFNELEKSLGLPVADRVAGISARRDLKSFVRMHTNIEGDSLKDIIEQLAGALIDTRAEVWKTEARVKREWSSKYLRLWDVIEKNDIYMDDLEATAQEREEIIEDLKVAEVERDTLKQDKKRREEKDRKTDEGRKKGREGRHDHDDFAKERVKELYRPLRALIHNYHPDNDWNDIERGVLQMLRELVRKEWQDKSEWPCKKMKSPRLKAWPVDSTLHKWGCKKPSKANPWDMDKARAQAYERQGELNSLIETYAPDLQAHYGAFNIDELERQKKMAQSEKPKLTRRKYDD